MFYVIGALFVLIGVYTLFYLRRISNITNDIPNWEVHEGHVINSHVKYGGPNEDDLLIFMYRYERNGQDIGSAKIDLYGMDERMNTHEREEFCKKYPVGRSVNVYVNPRSSRESVIEIGRTLAVDRVQNLGIFTIVVGFLFIVQAFLA